jgi:hypothetical protein
MNDVITIGVLFMMFHLHDQHDAFKSERIQQNASFQVHGSIEKVFPLFGPVKEKEWAEGWSPEIIYPKGVEVQRQMIFVTPGNKDESNYYWTVIRYEPSSYLIEYQVSTMNRIWFIEVICEPARETTRVTVTYTYTSLNAAGSEKNRSAMNAMFAHNLKDWEEAVNHYLQTGKKLTHSHTH